MTTRTSPLSTDRRRQLEADLDAYRRRGGEVKSCSPGERVGTRGDRDNSHLFGYRR